MAVALAVGYGFGCGCGCLWLCGCGVAVAVGFSQKTHKQAKTCFVQKPLKIQIVWGAKRPKRPKIHVVYGAKRPKRSKICVVCGAKRPKRSKIRIVGAKRPKRPKIHIFLGAKRPKCQQNVYILRPNTKSRGGPNTTSRTLPIPNQGGVRTKRTLVSGNGLTKWGGGVQGSGNDSYQMWTKLGLLVWRGGRAGAGPCPARSQPPGPAPGTAPPPRPPSGPRGGAQLLCNLCYFCFNFSKTRMKVARENATFAYFCFKLVLNCF